MIKRLLLTAAFSVGIVGFIAGLFALIAVAGAWVVLIFCAAAIGTLSYGIAEFFVPEQDSGKDFK